jgi:predicted RNA-binding Zn-ribbon protein involved in translation (DUF1610 family)
MIRRPQSSSLAGKRRQRDSIGEQHGPYVVTSYVGIHPETSESVYCSCPVCGHRVTRAQAQLAALDRIKKCGGCGMAAPVAVAAE